MSEVESTGSRKEVSLFVEEVSLYVEEVSLFVEIVILCSNVMTYVSFLILITNSFKFIFQKLEGKSRGPLVSIRAAYHLMSIYYNNCNCLTTKIWQYIMIA